MEEEGGHRVAFHSVLHLQSLGSALHPSHALVNDDAENDDARRL